MVILNIKVQILFQGFPKLHSCAHPSGSLNICYSSLSEPEKGKRGWVDNLISNQNPNKFYQVNRSVK